MIAKSDLDICRRGMQACVGRRVRVKSNGGRKRTVVHEGVLDSCYSKVFMVRCPVSSAYNEMVSFSYVDLLTKVVELVFDGTSSGELEEDEEFIDD